MRTSLNQVTFARTNRAVLNASGFGFELSDLSPLREPASRDEYFNSAQIDVWGYWNQPNPYDEVSAQVNSPNSDSPSPSSSSPGSSSPTTTTDPKNKGTTLADVGKKVAAFMKGPGGFALYAGFAAFSTYAKIKARKEKNEADRKNFLDQAKRAREQAQRRATNQYEEYEGRTSEATHQVVQSQLVSGGIEEGTGLRQTLKVNQARAKAASRDIIKQGEDVARQYEERAAAIDKGDTITDLLDIGTGVAEIARALPTKETGK